MSRKNWWLVGALVACLALPAFAGGGGHGCKADVQACLNKMAEKYAKRGWVGLELDEDKASGALTVEQVVPGSPAEAAGFKAGDVLVALNGIEFGEENYEALKKAKYKMAPGKQVTYTVARKGKNRDLAVTLAKLPDEVLAQWIGGHMIEDHVTIASAGY